MAAGDGGDAGNVDDVVARVRNGFSEDRFGLRPNHRVPGGIGVGVPDVVHLDAHASKAPAKQNAGAAVDARGRHDVLTRFGQGKQGGADRGLSTRHGNAGRAALQGGEPLFGDRVGGVALPGVDGFARPSVEPGGPVVEGIEDIPGAQGERRNARAAVLVGVLAHVHLAGVEAEGVPIGDRRDHFGGVRIA